MTTPLSSARIELSKQLNDYWAGTSTTPASALTTELTDTALKAKENAWITKGTFDLITDDTTNTNEERKISALVNTSGAITMLAHTSANIAGIEYEIHRLFTASEKRIALIAAARMAWPYIHEKIWDESMVSGNWLKDGSFEQWNSAGTSLTYWSKANSVITKTTSSPYYKHGAISCKISGNTEEVSQGIPYWDDLKRLAGQSVTFSIQAWCDTASCLRISINDGTTQTYSSYHAGDSAWTQDDPRNDSMYVQQFIDWNPTEITFTIHHENASATSYVDDARVIGPYQPRLFIETLGLAQEQPIQVEIEPTNYSTDEPWAIIFNSRLDTELGYIYLPSSVQRDRRLRIKGIGYLDFLDSDGASATAWDSTININSPQIDILIAQAILYLYTQMSLPNFSRNTRQDFQEMIGFWESKLRTAIGKFGMEVQSIPVRYQ